MSSVLITFTSCLDCDQAQLNVGPDLDPNAILICGQCPGILYARFGNTLFLNNLVHFQGTILQGKAYFHT